MTEQEEIVTIIVIYKCQQRLLQEVRPNHQSLLVSHPSHRHCHRHQRQHQRPQVKPNDRQQQQQQQVEEQMRLNINHQLLVHDMHQVHPNGKMMLTLMWRAVLAIAF
jgi:hypothetical protein